MDKTTPELKTNLSTNPVLELDKPDNWSGNPEKWSEIPTDRGNKVRLPSGTTYEITSRGWIRISEKIISTKRNKKQMYDTVKEVRRHKNYQKKS